MKKLCLYIMAISVLLASLSGCGKFKGTSEDVSENGMVNSKEMPEVMETKPTTEGNSANAGRESREEAGIREPLNMITEEDLKPFENFLVYTQEDDLFRVRLYINKLEFREDEKIEMYSTLEYIGKNETIDIWHGLPCFNYTIKGLKDFNTGGITLTVLMKSTVEKGVLYGFPYVKNGGYSEDAPDSAFWKKFYSEKDLFLPAGEYDISAYCAFSINENTENYDDRVEVKIKVNAK